MLGILIEPLMASSVQISSHDHHVWWTGDIYTGLALVSLFTMLFVTVLALVRVRRSPSLHSADTARESRASPKGRGRSTLA